LIVSKILSNNKLVKLNLNRTQLDTEAAERIFYNLPNCIREIDIGNNPQIGSTAYTIL